LVFSIFNTNEGVKGLRLRNISSLEFLVFS
jgi:hypothetical protein